ncbi:hypothetical protein KDL30_16005, partial [bacterium]|nr:hypothetical protein [bacterium]
ASACSRQAGEQASPLAFPTNWPEPAMTVPEGMDSAELFASLTLDSDDGRTVKGKPAVGDFDGELWAVGFATDESFANVLLFWEEELRAAGYSYVENDVESSSTRALARQYVSQDLHRIIVIVKSEGKSKESGRTRGVVKLSVCAEDIPLEGMLRRL